MRTAIRNAITDKYLNDVCEGEDFECLVDVVKQVLPSSVTRDALHGSLLDLAGERLVPKRIFETAWRLAGNMSMLTHKQAVTPWTHQPELEWVPVQIFQVRRKVVGRNTRGWQISFQALAGRCCPMILTKFWTQKFCVYISKELGFLSRLPSPNSNKPISRLYSHATELTNCRLNVLVDPKLSASEPMFEKTGVSPQHIEWNRDILKFRDRQEKGYACIRGYGHNVRCYRCPAGWTSCPAGTHRLDITYAFCTVCHEENAPYDIDISNEMCINCYERTTLANI